MDNKSQMRKKIYVGLIQVLIILIVLIPLWGMLMLYIFFYLFNLKFISMISSFIGWIFLIYFMIQKYHKSRLCVNCGKPYNITPITNEKKLFESKCQNCGFEF